MPNYKKTKAACYLRLITQAISAIFAPLLFLKFHNDYDISLGNIALISTFFFFTQLLVDLFCAKFVDRISITSKKMPAGGTAMFALLAMAGDLGGSIGPGIVGYVTQNSDNNIRVGMGIGLIFPLVLLIMLFILCKGKNTQESLHTV